MKICDKEKVLLEGLATNDTDEIETIYCENYSAIQAYVVKSNGYPDDARDIFQEAMIILCEGEIEPFVLSCQIKTYLCSVCRILWLKKLQKQNRYNPSIEMIQETVPVEDEIESHEKRNVDFLLMENALSKIGEPCKSLLEAFYIGKKSMTEIASSFRYANADNAKTQKYKCLVLVR